MDNPHNIRNQGAALTNCREVFRHDELIDVLNALHDARLNGAEVADIIERIKNEGERLK